MATVGAPKKVKDSFLNKILSGVERAGNKLPDPYTLFIMLAGVVVILSAICSYAGVSAIHPGTKAVIQPWNLLSKEGLRWMVQSAVNNFTTFAPLGVVMVALVGTGVAEKSGFLTIAMSKILGSAPPKVVTFAIIFISINGNMAGDSAFVIMPPLAAVIFLGLGRSPLLGMFCSFGAVAAGFCANLFINGLDFLIVPLTQGAAEFLDKSYETTPANNYYFLIASCIILSFVGTFVTEKFMAPRFEGVDISKYNYDKSMLDLTPQQKKGLRYAGYSLIVLVILTIGLCIGDNAFFKDPATNSLLSLKSTLMAGLLPIVTVYFFVPGTIYGFVSGQYHNDKELFAGITEAFRDMAPYVLLCIFCGQFTYYFGKSNLGAILAIKSAAFLESLHFTGIPLLIGLIIISCVVNLFIGSSSAKWTILAPVFVPMMMILHYDPALTQLAYRMGDSITNPLSPLFPYFPIILGFARRYEKETGMGNVIANMIPFSVSFGIVWIIMLSAWVLLEIPLGPGGKLLYDGAAQAALTIFRFV